MSTLTLTSGKVAIIDEADFDALSKWKWEAHWNKCTGSFYACRRERGVNGVQHRIYMHRFLMGLSKGERVSVDHRNHDTLDNRRENIRLATRQENNRNRKSRKPDGLKGVRKHRRKWIAEITHDRKTVYLGLFTTPTDAHAAYCDAASRLHGGFSCLN